MRLREIDWRPERFVVIDGEGKEHEFELFIGVLGNRGGRILQIHRVLAPPGLEGADFLMRLASALEEEAALLREKAWERLPKYGG